MAHAPHDGGLPRMRMMAVRRTGRALAAGVALSIMAPGTVCASWPASDIRPFAANVTRYVLLHELAHALIREFRLPILTNEEAMADSFATVWITQYMPDEAVAIIGDRVRSWMYEDRAVSPDAYDFRGSHFLDIRRAYQAACLLLGANPTEWQDSVAWVGFSGKDAADCSGTAPDQIEGWMRILGPHMLPEGRASRKVRAVYGEGPMRRPMQRAGLMEEIARIARRFDWPHRITFRFDHCDRGARWSSSRRVILLCDNYVLRFIRQGEALSGSERRGVLPTPGGFRN